MTILIRIARDEMICTITVPSVPIDGVLKRFELAGKQYEVRKASLMSTRTHLRERGRDTVLLAADHDALRNTFFTEDGGKAMFVVPATSVLKRFRPVRVGEDEIGKVIIGLGHHAHVSVFTLPVAHASVLAQVFVLTSL